MTNLIVVVNVSQQVAATPSTLQRTGAMLSQGATNTSPGTKSLLTQPSSLTPLLSGSHAITSITQTTGTATATTTSPHGFTVSDTIELTIAGSTIAAYNGTFLCTITGASAFTYAVPSGTTSPATGASVYTVEDVAELLAQVTTFFAQGTNTPVYVLELGAGSPTDGVNFLSAWITANPGIFYSYLVPRTWDANAAFLSLMASFESTTALTYFWITTTLATYTSYTSAMKCAKPLIEAPAYGAWAANVLTALSYANGQASATTTSAHGVAVGQWFQIAGCTPAGYNGWWQAQVGTTGSTLVWNIATTPGAESVLGTLVASYYTSAGIPAAEFSHAAGWQVTLNYNPSATNKVTPYSYSFLSGVTPFPAPQNSALITTLQNANIEIVATGAEAGISNTIALGGNFLDGNPVNYWYSVDAAQINVNRDISAAVIAGSNNPANPLYLDQDGINSLQSVANNTFTALVSVGLGLGSVVQTELDGTTFALNLANQAYAGQVVINAVPFNAVYGPGGSNPGDYVLGIYPGFTAVYTPQRGFTQVIFNIVVQNFVAL